MATPPKLHENSESPVTNNNEFSNADVDHENMKTPVSENCEFSNIDIDHELSLIQEYLESEVVEDLVDYFENFHGEFNLLEYLTDQDGQHLSEDVALMDLDTCSEKTDLMQICKDTMEQDPSTCDFTFEKLCWNE